MAWTSASCGSAGIDSGSDGRRRTRWQRIAALLAMLLAGVPLPTRAAEPVPAPKVWQTQTFPLRAGWSAIYSHVDAGHVELDELTQNNLDLEEIWRWNPEFSSLQFLDSPDQPTQSPGNWLVWRRGDPASTLERLSGNAAYLVRLRNGATQLEWSVQGSPVPTVYNWKSDGMNLIGFSTVPTGAPSLADFLAPIPRLLLNTPIFQYRGGELGPANPLQVVTHRTTFARRGEAFWVRADDATRYYGPFELQLQNDRGLHFGDQLSRYQLTLRNVSAQELTVQGALVASEAPPLGAEALAPGMPTLLVRGELNPTNLSHSYLSLGAGASRLWVLKPRGQAGSEITLHLGMNWSSLQGVPGALNGAIVRFTDSSGHMQYDLPLTARVPDTRGLWVGEATVTHVQEDLKSFRKSSDQGHVTAAQTGAVDLTWLKRQPEAGTPPDHTNASKWHEVDGLYFRKVVRNYLGVAVGEALLPPDVDENGVSVTNPGFYWQARPLDPSFAAGYVYDSAREVALANGYLHLVKLTWVKAAGVANPPNGTYPPTQETTYEGPLVEEELPPPSRADVSVTAAFWNPRPAEAPDLAPFSYAPSSEVVTSRVAGDVTVVWLRQAAAETTPADANDTTKWFLDAGRYYRKHEVTYAGVQVGAVLAAVEEDEFGVPLEEGDVTYWQPRPFHPSFVVGYAFNPGTGETRASGTLANVGLLWLRAGNNDPAMGQTRQYTNVVDGTLLAPPLLTQNPVPATHWEAQPANAPSQPPFQFQPTGERYEITDDGRYVQTSASRTMAKVAKAMPLRLILHSAPTGTGQYAVSLLQRVYFATDALGALVLANNPAAIAGNTVPIRRISSVHVPWTPANAPIASMGDLRFGLTGEMITSYADPISNPFVHGYHPDHDNLDARYEQPLGPGQESYGVRRRFTLTPASATLDFESLSRGGDTRTGIYEERIQLEGKDGFLKEYQIRGGYLLRRIVPTPTLLVQ